MWCMGCTKLKAWSEALGARCSLEAKASCVSTCKSTPILENGMLSLYFLSLAKRKRSCLNYRVPDCQSLSSLTFQLQISASFLPARAGSGREALAEAPCSCPGSNLPFADFFFYRFCTHLACFFFSFAPGVASSWCFSNFGVKQVGRMLSLVFDLGPLLKGSVCRIMARGNARLC